MENKLGSSKSDTEITDTPELKSEKGKKSVTLDLKKTNSLEEFIEKTASNVEISQQTESRGQSFILGKIAELEKELTYDNIQPRVKSIFQPNEPGMSATSENGQSYAENPPNQLSSSMAAVFMIGGTTGTGLQNLPYALKNSSWYGVFLVILIGINALYAGLCTGWSWNIMEERWPEYKAYRRVPYQDIAYRAVGIWMKYIVGILIDVTSIATCAVYALILGNEIKEQSPQSFTFCWALFFVVLVLTPFMAFNYYRDMKFIAVLDTILSLAFTILLIIGIILDREVHRENTYSDPGLESFTKALALFAFAYGKGHIYPSILSDMVKRELFPHACGTAYLIVTVMYLIMPMIVFAAYGDETNLHFLNHISEIERRSGFRLVIEIINIIQIATTFIIILIPTMHAFEERLNCPLEFSYRRILIRFVIMLFMLLLVLGMPFLLKFIHFLGGTLMNLLTFIFPPIFYICLLHQRVSLFSKKSSVSKKEWFMLVEMILIGIIVAVTSMYVSITTYLESPPNRDPCYYNMSS